jgi:SAM-dependent methyltransferase
MPSHAMAGPSKSGTYFSRLMREQAGVTLVKLIAKANERSRGAKLKGNTVGKWWGRGTVPKSPAVRQRLVQALHALWTERAAASPELPPPPAASVLLDEIERLVREDEALATVVPPPPPPPVISVVSGLPPSSSLRPGVDRALPLAPGVTEAHVVEAVAAAIEGIESEGFLFGRATHIVSFGKRQYFHCERHRKADVRNIPVGEPRSDACVVAVGVRYDAQHGAPALEIFDSGVEAELACRRELGALPHAGQILDLHTLHLPSSLLRDGSIAPGGFGQGPRALALVIELPRDRTGNPSSGTFLRLDRCIRDEAISRNRTGDVLELAHALTTVLLMCHARGRPHGALSTQAVLVRRARDHARDFVLLGIGQIAGAFDGAAAQQIFANDRAALSAIIQTAMRGHAPADLDVPRPPSDEVLRRLHYACVRHLRDAPLSEDGPSLLLKLLGDLQAIRLIHGQWLRDAVAANRRPQRTGDDSLAAQVYTLCRMADDKLAFDWCKTYVAPPSSDARLLGMSLDNCLDHLADKGRGRAAAEHIGRLLAGDGLPLDEVPRALRYYAGILAPREGAHELAARMIDRWHRIASEPAASPEEQAKKDLIKHWTALLRQKTAYVEARASGDRSRLPASIPHLRKPDPGGGPERERARKWLVLQEALITLASRARAPLYESELREVLHLMHGRSSVECCAGALVAAKALSAKAHHDLVKSGIPDPSPVHTFRQAIQAVLLAASTAALRGYPHEYAEALLLSARVVRRAFATPAFRGSLLSDGANADECLQLAAECALRAADLYQKLDVPERQHAALLVAARCLFEADALETVAAGFRYWSMAKNLRWLPAGADAAPEGDFRAPRLSDLPASRLEADERAAFERGSSQWALRRGVLERERGLSDPGEWLAAEYYRIYGPGIARAFGTWPDEPATVSIEMVRGEGVSAVPRREGVARELENMALQADRTHVCPRGALLELGCGVGRDGLWLLQSGRLEIDRYVGVDPSLWSVHQAKEAARRTGLFGRAQFLCSPLVDHMAGAPRRVPEADRFAIVLLRDALAHVTAKRELIASAFDRLERGGLLLLTDWVQRKMTSRTSWSRLLERLWLTDLSTEAEHLRALAEAGFEVVERRQRDQDMMSFFQSRHAALAAAEHARQALLSEGKRPPDTSDALIEAARARGDIGMLAALCDEGVLGWTFFCARRRG